MGPTDRQDPFGTELEGVDALSWSVFRTWRSTDKLNRLLFMRLLAERGGHPGQAICLWVLSGNDGISQRELAEIVHLAPPTVTAMLQKMERHGLVERKSDERDQRLVRLRLTDAGREMAAGIREAHAAYVNDTIGALAEDDRREFERLLEALSGNLRTALERFGDSQVPWHGAHGTHGFSEEDGPR
jgi:DNA-binding MarR family transcriptional regulator